MEPLSACEELKTKLLLCIRAENSGPVQEFGV